MEKNGFREIKSNRPGYVNYLPLLLALMLVIGMLVGFFVKNKVIKEDQKTKIDYVFEYIMDSYVDPVNEQNLREQAIQLLLQELDPHSYYITTDEMKGFKEELRGNFEGIGIQFRIQFDTVVVLDVIAGGPSEKVGLLPGDRIVKVDDTLMVGEEISNNKVIKKLKGEKGTKVKVSVFRRNKKALIDFEIIRDKIPTYSLDIAYMITPEIGYIALNKFSATTYNEFHDAMEHLIEKGMQKLILDLRGNGGGYLNAAIEIADDFLEKDLLIVYTEGRARKKVDYYSKSRGIFEKQDIVVLINPISASASEIVAGAIQDNDRGLIIGRKSFGKGLVQEQIEFSDGSAIRLTVARYHTPSGRCIQREYKNGAEAYMENFYDNLMDADHVTIDTTEIADSLKYKTRNGRTVYGGGGIIPDILIPWDTNSNTKYYNSLLNRGLIFQFAIEYADANRGKITKKFPSAEAFSGKFSVTSPIMEAFYQYLSTKETEPPKTDKRATEDLIKNNIKAELARYIYNNEGYYRVVNKQDKVVLKAIEVLKSNTIMNHLSQ